mgnify:CR=1 FL=1
MRGSSNGSQALEKFANVKPDLVILDIMMPGLDGFEVCERIRQVDGMVPVLFFSAKGDIVDKRIGYKLGADDYLVKPFEIVELLARVETVLRRVGKGRERIQIGDVVIDESSMQVTKGGEPVSLTKKEFDLLLLFVRNQTWRCFARRFMSGSGRRSTPETAARWTCMCSGCGRSWGGSTA